MRATILARARIIPVREIDAGLKCSVMPISSLMTKDLTSVKPLLYRVVAQFSLSIEPGGEVGAS